MRRFHSASPAAPDGRKRPSRRSVPFVFLVACFAVVPEASPARTPVAACLFDHSLQVREAGRPLPKSADLPGTNTFFLHYASGSAGDGVANGRISLLRLIDGVLSPRDVAALDADPFGEAVIPDPSPCALLADLGVIGAGPLLRRYGVPFRNVMRNGRAAMRAPSLLLVLGALVLGASLSAHTDRRDAFARERSERAMNRILALNSFRGRGA